MSLPDRDKLVTWVLILFCVKKCFERQCKAFRTCMLGCSSYLQNVNIPEWLTEPSNCCIGDSQMLIIIIKDCKSIAYIYILCSLNCMIELLCTPHDRCLCHAPCGKFPLPFHAHQPKDTEWVYVGQVTMHSSDHFHPETYRHSHLDLTLVMWPGNTLCRGLSFLRYLGGKSTDKVDSFKWDHRVQ